MRDELLVQENPKSPIAEVFRTLRTNIQFMNRQKELKTILITSTMPEEGKSWISSNLAITFAKAGKRVLLIDGDMRKGRLHVMFKTDNIPGLSNFLSNIDENGKVQNPNIIKYVRQTKIENLYLIPCGNIPPNPAELLTSDSTIDMLDKLKKYFEIIIIDGTPSSLVTDALILSRLVDSTIIVASYKMTKKGSLAKVKKDIENVGGKIAGVVINKIPVKSAKYESTYYYGSTSMIKTNSDFDLELNNKEKNYFKTDRNISREKSDEIISQLNDFLNSK